MDTERWNLAVWPCRVCAPHLPQLVVRYFVVPRLESCWHRRRRPRLAPHTVHLLYELERTCRPLRLCPQLVGQLSISTIIGIAPL